jgi:hypothetical protein
MRPEAEKLTQLLERLRPLAESPESGEAGDEQAK